MIIINSLFTKEIYLLLIDDYIHIITKHSNDLNQIYNLMIEKYNIKKCIFNKCLSAIRHHRNRLNDNIEQINENECDLEFIFYKNILDSIHCYLFHLYDVGLRIKINNNNYGKQTNEFDPYFANIQKIIKQKRNMLNKLNNFDFKRYNNNKFSLIVNNNTQKTDENIEGIYLLFFL